MARRAPRPSILAPGGFGAFVVEQLEALGHVEARPMFGGAGFYLEGQFFGILYGERLYFRVSPDTIDEYRKRKMQPFAPFQGRKGESRRYYEVPLEILESADDLIAWARAAANGPPPAAKRRVRQRGER
jgi:DNA transformation protein and related proteins